jgi:uncharacterized protein (DUF58 family)
VTRLAGPASRPLGLLLAAATMAAAAGTVASLALFALAVGLALLTVSAGITVVVASSRVRVARTIVEREVQEDAPVRLRFDVQGMGRLGVRVEVEDDAGGWLDVRPPGAVAEVRVARRGEYRLLPSHVRVRDALGIFQRSRRVGSAEPLLILPAPVAQSSLDPAQPAAAGDPEPEGLQAHTPGLPLTRIHWPALARGAGLQVRRFAASPGGLPLVIVDTAGTCSSQAVDWAARTAAGQILALTRSGGCRVVLPGDAHATTVAGVDAGWRALHRRLARLGHSTHAPAAPRAPEASAILIRAAAAPPRQLRVLPPLPAGVVRLAIDGREAAA